MGISVRDRRFIEELTARLHECQRQLGLAWLDFQAQLLGLMKQLVTAADDLEVRKIVDRILELGIERPEVANLFVEARRAAGPTDISYGGTRAHREPVPGTGEVRPQSESRDAVTAAGQRIIEQLASQAIAGTPIPDDQPPVTPPYHPVVSPSWSGRGLLGIESGQPSPVIVEPEKRWVNVEVMNHPKNHPIKMNQTYTLMIDVDTTLRATSLTTEDDVLKAVYPDSVSEIQVAVQVFSNDFRILSDRQKLYVPRTGRSLNQARFDFMALHEGPASITAVLSRDNNPFQLVTITLQVGTMQAIRASVSSVSTASLGNGDASVHTSAVGLPVSAAFRTAPRDLSLVIKGGAKNSGFEIMLLGKGLHASINLTQDELDTMITQARNALLQIVQMWGGPDNNLVYQWSLDIPADVNQTALTILAGAGYDLFNGIFYGPLASQDLRGIGDYLRSVAKKQKLRIKVFSESFMLPWGMLYLAESYDSSLDSVNPNLFLGLRHIIEHIPAQPNNLDIDRCIDSGNLKISLNVNLNIDTEIGRPIVAEQMKYWQDIATRGNVQVTTRTTEADVKRALRTPDPDQILYFNCHAVSRGLNEGGPNKSGFVLTTDAAMLTLGELNRVAPMHQTYLPGAPLVFINACQSAEMSPLFYNGFVPYFMGKGARGVIGTECDTPAIFAAEFAKRFFAEFLAGKELGDILLRLRQEFYQQHNNILGLLYSLYCDGETILTPGVQLVSDR